MFRTRWGRSALFSYCNLRTVDPGPLFSRRRREKRLTRPAVPSGLGVAEAKMSMTSNLKPPPSILSRTGQRWVVRVGDGKRYERPLVKMVIKPPSVFTHKPQLNLRSPSTESLTRVYTCLIGRPGSEPLAASFLRHLPIRSMLGPGRPALVA